MGWPCRFSVMSYNLWNTLRWDERRPALEAFFAHHRPDLLMLQELRRETRDALDGWLSEHRRVQDEDLKGWTCESNLYWRDELFEYEDHGAEWVEHLEPERRLFWVRLKPRHEVGGTLLLAMVHLTWVGNPTEKAGGPSPRPKQAEMVVDSLMRLRRPDEPLLLGGDMNDAHHAIRLLRESGLEYLQALLGRFPEVTWPALPTGTPAVVRGAPHSPEAIDWILVDGPLQVLGAEVIDYHHNDIAPSDHKPVLGFCELRGA